MEFIKDFIIFLTEHGSSKATVKNYKADIGQFISWYEASYKTAFQPENISSDIIKSYKTDKLKTDSNGSLSLSSVNRHLSSLRKFYSYLESENIVSENPFESLNPTPQDNDPWHIRRFKDYLYSQNASRLTIKNYLIDVKQFLKWAEEVVKAQEAWIITDQNIFKYVNSKLLKEYQARLIESSGLSPISINRKMSSLRKYIAWSIDQGIVPDAEVGVNIPVQKEFTAAQPKISMTPKIDQN